MTGVMVLVVRSRGHFPVASGWSIPRGGRLGLRSCPVPVWMRRSFNEQRDGFRSGCWTGQFGVGSGPSWPFVERWSRRRTPLRVCRYSILVLTIIGTAIAASLARPVAGFPYGSLVVPLAAGLALTSLVAALGPISGAHLQSSFDGRACHQWSFRVDACCALRRSPVLWLCRCSTHRLGSLWRQSQDRRGFGGHLSGTRGRGRSSIDSGSDCDVRSHVDHSVRRVDPTAAAGLSAIAIGFALAGAIFISGPVSGGAVNPARAIGPMLVAGKFTDWWVYLVGPVIGATAAVGVHRALEGGRT